MIGRDRVRNVLQQHRLTGARRCHDQAALALCQWGDNVDDARRKILDCRILDFQLQPLGRIKRRQVVEVNLVAAAAGSSKLTVLTLSSAK